MNLSKLALLPSTVLHAICVECPDADIDSVCERTTLLLDEKEEIGSHVIAVVLKRLREDSLVWSEIRPPKKDDGLEEVYLFPTEKGRKQDKTYMVNHPSDRLYSAVPSLE